MIAGWFLRLLGCVLLLSVAACASQEAFPSDPSRVASAAQPYQLVAGDKLHITTYNEPSLTGDYSVGINGDLAFPLIGAVKAQGQTPPQLQAMLTAKLGDGFLLNPRVSVEVLSYRPVYVLGEVNKPGEYDYVPGMTALAAIAKAGGFTYRAKEKAVFIKRRDHDQEVEIQLNSDTPINPGDTIRVAERYF